MKKILLFLTVSLVLLAAPVLLLAQKPVFDNATTQSYEGACKSATVQTTFQIVSGIKKVTQVKKNKNKSKNVAVTFTNRSGLTVSGTIAFDDGLWLSFSGPAVMASTSRFMGQVPVTGAARLSGDVTYDLNAKTFAGTGEIVTFDGSMDLKGLLKSNNNKAMMKVFVTPSTVTYNVFGNASSVQQQPVMLKVKFPAIQMKRMP